MSTVGKRAPTHHPVGLGDHGKIHIMWVWTFSEKTMNTQNNDNQDTKTIDQLDDEQKDILFAAMSRCSIDPKQVFTQNSEEDSSVVDQ